MCTCIAEIKESYTKVRHQTAEVAQHRFDMDDYHDCMSDFQELCSDLQTFNIDLRRDEEFLKACMLHQVDITKGLVEINDKASLP